MASLSKSNLILTYALLVFIWSTTPLAIVWSVDDLHPLWALVLRFFIALPLAAVLMLLLRQNFPLNKVALHSYLAGAFSLIGSQFFTYIATAYLSSGIIALMFGLAPIMAGLIGLSFFKQKLHVLQWLGMLIALCGLGLICFAGENQHVNPIGIALMLMSVLSYAASIFWVKKVNATHVAPVAQATGSILVSTLMAMCVLPFIWQYAPTSMPSLKSISALLYTVIMASLIAMFCYFKLVKNIKATTLSLTTVMTPMLAIFFGAWLNQEKLSLMVFVGAGVLLFGLAVYFYRDFKISRNLQRKVG
ncbi:EamA family transporter [Acinetobacter sp. B51(2017)]|uniref:DMT family transporter n=1 Tax=Acinetobacter sp. B51(2017) TaxID=2060938 RepID=UPI000F0771F0|nr:EamA family transporter [Acinetobacter sp. B51(2017)]